MSEKATTEGPGSRWQLEFPPEIQALREPILAALVRAMDEGRSRPFKRHRVSRACGWAVTPKTWRSGTRANLSPCSPPPWPG